MVLTAAANSLHEEPNYRIMKPLLLVHGERDNLGNIKKDAPKWAARDPHCHYVVIPDAGHCSNQDNPEFFNRTLLEWLAQEVH
jgi:pimeloyl-ACP methyl ester carboxylesterase